MRQSWGGKVSSGLFETLNEHIKATLVVTLGGEP